MSEEFTARDPVELTRRAYAAVNSGDAEAIIGFFGPESVWDMSHMGLGTYKGLPAIRRFLQDWRGSFDRYELTIEEIFPVAGGVVYLVCSLNARSAGSAAHVRMRYSPVLLWVDGVALMVTHYRDIDESRGAAEALAASRA